MNHFFALEVPPEAQRYIQQEVVALWKPALMDVASWYAPEDYHITLKFLGNIAEERQQDLIQDLIAAANFAVREVSPFAVELAAPGSFPSHRAKRIFWMGIRRSSEIAELSRQIDRLCSQLEFERENRAYTPHITVARYPRRKGSDSADCAPIMGERSFPFWQATQLVLMRTLPPEKRANGAKGRYNLVHTFPFGSKQVSDVSQDARSRCGRQGETSVG